MHNRKIKVATIDTILSFYLAFYYSNQPYYHKDRIICMAKFLFDLEQKNRLEQKGLLKRFSINCYGKQSTLSSIRAEKTEKYRELKNKQNSHEFKEWFLNYKPHTTIKVAKNPNEKKLDKLYTPDLEDKEPSKEQVYKKILDSVTESKKTMSSSIKPKQHNTKRKHTIKSNKHRTQKSKSNVKNK